MEIRSPSNDAALDSARTTRRELLFGIAAAAALTATVGTRPALALNALETYVQRRGNEVIAAANASSASRFQSLMRRHADMRHIGQFALGSYANRLPASRRGEYQRLFEAWLGRKFVKHSRRLTGKSFQVTTSRGGPVTYIVNGRVLGGGRMPVSFRVRRTGGGYKVRDVNIGGIWLTLTIREAITRHLRRSNGDFNVLFAYLQPG